MKTKIYGITGGICAGKSVVCKIFEALGIPIYYADQRAKAIVIEDKNIKNKIIDLFGNESYLANGQYNRQFISKEIFADAYKLKAINAIIHPAVKKDAELWVQKQDTSFVLYEAALIKGKDSRFDGTILVTASQKTRLKRALKRDTYRNEADVLKIFDAQFKDEDWEKEVDFVINNNDTDSVLEQTLVLYRTLKKLSL